MLKSRLFFWCDVGYDTNQLLKDAGFQTVVASQKDAFVVKPVCGRAFIHVHDVESKAALPGVVEQVKRAPVVLQTRESLF